MGWIKDLHYPPELALLIKNLLLCHLLDGIMKLFRLLHLCILLRHLWQTRLLGSWRLIPVLKQETANKTETQQNRIGIGSWPALPRKRNTESVSETAKQHSGHIPGQWWVFNVFKKKNHQTISNLVPGEVGPTIGFYPRKLRKVPQCQVFTKKFPKEAEMIMLGKLQ